MQLGSSAHRDLFCQSFMATHLNYEPEQMPFPSLDSKQLALLKGIPFWEQARNTEREAGILVSAFAESIADPVIREAVALQGQEEVRHAKLIKTLIDHYGIEINEPPAFELPQNIEKSFTVFGFEECLDSFFAFGLFGIAREAALLPETLFTIFDPILDEEARHIVFFVNWFTYRQIELGRGFLPVRAFNTAWGYSQALRRLIAAFTGADTSGSSFTATSADSLALDVTPEKFVLTCLQENQKRMSQFEPQLLRPQLLAHLSSVALQILRLMPQKTQNPNLERA